MSLGSVHEIVGSFVGSSRTLDEATREVEPIMDDRPLQEYGVRSMLSIGFGVPGGIVDLRGVSEWCPDASAMDVPLPALEQLDTYFELLSVAYGASRQEIARARRLFETENRVIAGSAYLGAIVPESADDTQRAGPVARPKRRARSRHSGISPGAGAGAGRCRGSLAHRRGARIEGRVRGSNRRTLRDRSSSIRATARHITISGSYSLFKDDSTKASIIWSAPSLSIRESDAARRNLAEVRQQRERAAGQP